MNKNYKSLCKDIFGFKGGLFCITCYIILRVAEKIPFTHAIVAIRYFQEPALISGLCFFIFAFIKLLKMQIKRVVANYRKKQEKKEL